MVQQHPPTQHAKEDATFEFQNQTERTYETILERIQRGEPRPGETLKARRLARELGVNPVTVQRAAEWLRNDGLLERQRRRGWRVVNLLMIDLGELYDLRILLESRVLPRAARQLEPKTLETLEAEADRIIVLGEQATVYERRQADLNSHITLARHCGSRVLCETVEPLIRRPILITTVAFRFSRVVLAFGENKAVLRALRHGDIETATQALQSHLRTSASLTVDPWSEAEQQEERERTSPLAKTEQNH